MRDYSKGKIYKLVYEDLIYIGSTIQRLSKRKAHHKEVYNKYLKGNFHFCSSFELYKKGIPEIFLIEEVNAIDNKELMIREREHILKNKCVNIAIPSLLTNKEQKQKEKIDNREYYLNYNKEYYQKTKEDLQIKITCECGKIISKMCLKRHKTRKFHQNYLSNLP